VRRIHENCLNFESMFTGIIEEIGVITDIQKDAGNIHFTIESKLSDELKIDQSVAHNGCCLTVVGLSPGSTRCNGNPRDFAENESW
jgi:riboflavin synthase alpha subunit